MYRCAKILQNSSLGESDKCENSFMYLDHQKQWNIQTDRQRDNLTTSPNEVKNTYTNLP